MPPPLHSEDLHSRMHSDEHDLESRPRTPVPTPTPPPLLPDIGSPPSRLQTPSSSPSPATTSSTPPSTTSSYATATNVSPTTSSSPPPLNGSPSPSVLSPQESTAVVRDYYSRHHGDLSSSFAEFGCGVNPLGYLGHTFTENGYGPVYNSSNIATRSHSGRNSKTGPLATAGAQSETTQRIYPTTPDELQLHASPISESNTATGSSRGGGVCRSGGFLFTVSTPTSQRGGSSPVSPRVIRPSAQSRQTLREGNATQSQNSSARSLSSPNNLATQPLESGTLSLHSRHGLHNHFPQTPGTVSAVPGTAVHNINYSAGHWKDNHRLAVVAIKVCGATLLSCAFTAMLFDDTITLGITNMFGYSGAVAVSYFAVYRAGVAMVYDAECPAVLPTDENRWQRLESYFMQTTINMFIVIGIALPVILRTMAAAGVPTIRDVGTMLSHLPTFVLVCTASSFQLFFMALSCYEPFWTSLYLPFLFNSLLAIIEGRLTFGRNRRAMFIAVGVTAALSLITAALITLLLHGARKLRKSFEQQISAREERNEIDREFDVWQDSENNDATARDQTVAT